MKRYGVFVYGEAFGVAVCVYIARQDSTIRFPNEERVEHAKCSDV